MLALKVMRAFFDFWHQLLSSQWLHSTPRSKRQPIIQLGCRVFATVDLPKRSESRQNYADTSPRFTVKFEASLAAGLGPSQEIYSIDESFIDVTGVRDVTVRAKLVRDRILQWTGLPCGIGIAQTKTLAKLANFVAKTAERKPGSYPAELAQVANLAALPASDFEAVLAATELGEVWGIDPTGTVRSAAQRTRSFKELVYGFNALLREALKKSNKVGIAKVVIATKQHLAVLIPCGPALILNLLRWGGEIRSTEALKLPPNSAKEAGIRDAELNMALELIEDMSQPWDADQFRNSFADEVMKLIEEKAQSGEIHAVSKVDDETAPQGGEVVDLTALLQRSLQRKTGQEPTQLSMVAPAASKARKAPAAAKTKPAVKAPAAPAKKVAAKLASVVTGKARPSRKAA